jgi:hypothetical protein
MKTVLLFDEYRQTTRITVSSTYLSWLVGWEICSAPDNGGSNLVPELKTQIELWESDPQSI